MSKKRITNEVFDKYEDAVLGQYESGELTRDRAKELLVEFYMEYEKESEE
jgi:hypothetical protein